LLLSSRKFVVFLVTVLTSTGTTVALRFGWHVNDATLAAFLTPIVAGGLTLITGIASEDAAAKSAGVGMQTKTTTEPLPSGGVEQTSTVASVPEIVPVQPVPDPTGKP
jgi:uncharacterized membrane protein